MKLQLYPIRKIQYHIETVDWWSLSTGISILPTAFDELIDWSTRTSVLLQCSLHSPNQSTEQTEILSIIAKNSYKRRKVRWNTVWRETVASRMCNPTVHLVFYGTRCSSLFHTKCCFISPPFFCTKIRNRFWNHLLLIGLVDVEHCSNAHYRLNQSINQSKKTG